MQRLMSRGVMKIPGLYLAILNCHRKCLIVLFLSLIAVSLFGGYVQVQIVDENGRELESVKVVQGREIRFSDAQGWVKIRDNQSPIEFSRLGYEILQLDFNQIHDRRVVLQSKDLLLPLIRVRALEYRSKVPALDAHVIHPDTNAQALGAANLLLESSSFSSSDNQLLGDRQTLSLLGSLSRHTLVMLDGIALNVGGEAFDFSKIPVSQIERIEIIKGNASAYGGSSAIGGIVNIISRSSARMARAELGTEITAGSFGMYRQQYQLSLLQHNWTLNANYEHYQAENDFRYEAWWDEDADFERRHNAKTSDKVFLKSNVHFSGQSLEYTLSQSSFIRQLPGPINFLDLYDDSRMSGENWYHSLRHNWEGKYLSNETQLFYQSDGSKFMNLASTNPINPSHYTQDQSNLGVQNRLSWLWQQSSAELISEYKRLHYAFKKYNCYGQAGSTTIHGERENLAFGLRAKQDYYLSWIMGSSQLSLRRDFENKNSHDSWRLEQDFSYQSKLKYSLGASYGTAFSLPSFYDMYWIGDSETQGNPELKNENSQSYSLRARLEHECWELEAARYYNEIENLIQWRQVFLFGSIWKPFNVGQARIINHEVSGKLKLMNWLQLDAGITFTQAKDYSLNEDGVATASYGKYLPYTPKLKSQVGIKYADQNRSCFLKWTYTGEQYSTVDNLIEPLPGFAVVDLDLMQKFVLGRFELAFQVQLANLLNKQYQIYAYIPQPGFNWACGLKLSYALGEMHRCSP
ncbi:MAG: TonB-dependent receptor [Candidatus Cloacimonetes bacterium]|nr:TonB-dependent receptor [Candidatus Cloacimonadota bacterium]